MLAATSRRGRGRLTILTARVTDDTGEISATWFNQPWLEAQLTPGTRVRLRGKPNRYGFQVDELRPRRGDRDRRLRAGVPRQRGARPEATARSRRRCTRARPRGRRCVARAARARRAAAASRGRARRAAPARARSRRPRSGRRRLAFDELLVLQLALARRAAERERLVAEALPPAGRASAALSRGAPVHAHRRPGAGDRRDRRRPREDDADAAAAPGRRRLRQDGRCALRRCCGPSRRAGRAR